MAVLDHAVGLVNDEELHAFDVAHERVHLREQVREQGGVSVPYQAQACT